MFDRLKKHYKLDPNKSIQSIITEYLGEGSQQLLGFFSQCNDPVKYLVLNDYGQNIEKNGWMHATVNQAFFTPFASRNAAKVEAGLIPTLPLALGLTVVLTALTSLVCFGAALAFMGMSIKEAVSGDSEQACLLGEFSAAYALGSLAALAAGACLAIATVASPFVLLSSFISRSTVTAIEYVSDNFASTSAK